MSTIVQISDPHFGTERPAVVEALLGFVAEQSPELVVLSGDITQRATRSEFDAARRFTDRLRTPAVLAIAGNHDVPLFNVIVRAFAPYRGYRRVYGPVLEPEHRSDAWLVLGVRTTRRWRHQNGEISARQIERVAGRLATADPAQARVVVVHQPVAVEHEEDRGDLVRGHREAVRRWAEAGADLIIGGHIHRPYVVPLHTGDAGLARPMWCVQAGTALSSRVRNGIENSVNILRHDGMDVGGRPLVVVERWDFAPTTGRFERVMVERLALGAAAAAVS